MVGNAMALFDLLGRMSIAQSLNDAPLARLDVAHSENQTSRVESDPGADRPCPGSIQSLHIIPHRVAYNLHLLRLFTR